MPELSPLPSTPPPVSDAAAAAAQKPVLASLPPIIESRAYPAATQTEFYHRAQTIRPDLTTQELSYVWALRGGEEGLPGAIDYVVRARDNPWMIRGSAALRGEQPTGFEPSDNPPPPSPLTEQQALQVKLGPVTVQSALAQFAPYRQSDGKYDLGRALREDPELAGAARIAGFPEAAITAGSLAAIAAQYQLSPDVQAQAKSFLEQYKVTSGPDAGKYNLVKLAQDDPEFGLGVAQASGMFTSETLSHVADIARKVAPSVKVDSDTKQAAQSVQERVSALPVANVSDAVAAKAQEDITHAGGLLAFFQDAIERGEEPDIGKAKTALYADPDIITVHSVAAALSSLKDYRNADGSYRLAEALADGRSPDTLVMAGWSPKVIGDSQAAARAMLDRDALLRDLWPYRNADGTYNLAQAVADGFDRPTLGRAFADVDIDQAVVGSIGTPTTARAAEIVSGVPTNEELQATGFARPRQPVIPVGVLMPSNEEADAMYRPSTPARAVDVAQAFLAKPTDTTSLEGILKAVGETHLRAEASKEEAARSMIAATDKVLGTPIDVDILHGKVAPRIKGVTDGYIDAKAPGVLTTSLGTLVDVYFVASLPGVVKDIVRLLPTIAREVGPETVARILAGIKDLAGATAETGQQAAAKLSTTRQSIVDNPAVSDVLRSSVRGVTLNPFLIGALPEAAPSRAAKVAVKVMERPELPAVDTDEGMRLANELAKLNDSKKALTERVSELLKAARTAAERERISQNAAAERQRIEQGITTNLRLQEQAKQAAQAEQKAAAEKARLAQQKLAAEQERARQFADESFQIREAIRKAQPEPPKLKPQGKSPYELEIEQREASKASSTTTPTIVTTPHVTPKSVPESVPSVVSAPAPAPHQRQAPTEAPAEVSAPRSGAAVTLSPALAPSYAPAYAPEVRPATVPEVVTVPRVAPQPAPEPAPAEVPAPSPRQAPAPAYAPSEAPSQAPSVAPEAVPSVRLEAAPTVAVAVAPSAGVAPGASPSPGPGASPAPAPQPKPGPFPPAKAQTTTRTSKDTEQSRPVVIPRGREPMQYAETVRNLGRPTYSFRQDFVVVRIPPPYEGESVDYSETPVAGDVVVRGPKQAFMLIKRQIGFVPKTLLKEFADLAQAPRE